MPLYHLFQISPRSLRALREIIYGGFGLLFLDNNLANKDKEKLKL
jgi:hypothetical protein